MLNSDVIKIDFFFFLRNTIVPRNVVGETLHNRNVLNPPVFVYSVICDMFRPVTEIIHIRHWELLPSLHLHLHVIVKVLGDLQNAPLLTHVKLAVIPIVVYEGLPR